MKRGEMIIVPQWFISLTLIEFALLVGAAGSAVYLYFCSYGKRAHRRNDQRREMARLDRIVRKADDPYLGVKYWLELKAQIIELTKAGR